MNEPSTKTPGTKIKNSPMVYYAADGSGRVVCGAKTKSGKPCQRSPMENRNRCRLHGGKAGSYGVAHAAKPGSIYSRFFTPEELAAHDTLELGNVDAELRLVRIRLARAMELERKDLAGELEPNLEKRIERDGGGDDVVYEERHYSKVDYRFAINACLARIESLEKTRQELTKANGGGNEDIAAQLRSLADKLPV